MGELTRKEQIKAKAAHMFRKKGYVATSMRDIAAEMNMEASSLYNHISGKQQILEELLMMVAQAFTQGMAVVKSAKLTNSERLERLVKLHVDITVDHTDAVSMLTNEWVHLEGYVAEEFKALKVKYEKDMKKIVNTAIKEGQLADVNTDLALFSMLSTLRWLYSWYSKNPTVNRIELEQEMVRLLIPKAS